MSVEPHQKAGISPDEFRELLKVCGFSQRGLADFIGRSMQIVSLWACGHQPVPRYVVAFLLAFARLPPHEKARVRAILP